MNNFLNINIPGKPIGKQRARKGKYGTWYNPQSDLVAITKNIIKNQLPENFKYISKNVPVIINICFYFKPTKSQKKIQNFDPYLKKCDVDNLSKFYLDCMSKLVFYDDNQVFSQKLLKQYYLPKEYTLIEIIW